MANAKRKRDRQADLEKERMLSPERAEKKRKAKKRRVLLAVCLAIACLILCAAVGFQIVRAVGKSGLEAKAASAAPVFEDTGIFEAVTEEEKASVEWQEGWVKYKGATYAYNKDITTFLIMGIDKSGEVIEVAEGTNGGQAGALFLLILNPHEKTIRILAINRNTMFKSHNVHIFRLHIKAV